MFTVYLKPTEYCNLKCSHCYVPEEKRRNEKKMSIEEVNFILTQIKNYFKNEKVLIQFHGGEPLLMGVDYYKKIYDKWNGKFYFGVQTNLTLYNSSWDELIENMFKGSLGTSFDFTRQFSNGGFAAFLKVWEEKYFQVRSKYFVSMGCILHKKNFLKGVFYWVNFIKKYAPHKISFISYVDIPHRADLVIDYTDYINFLISFIDSWGMQGEDIFCIKQINNFKNIQNIRSGCFGGFCSLSHIVINPDGTVGACPALSPNGYIFGNIYKMPIGDILESKARQMFIFKQLTLEEECIDCEYHAICNSGCFALRQINLMQRTNCKDFFSKMIELSLQKGGTHATNN